MVIIIIQFSIWRHQSVKYLLGSIFDVSVNSSVLDGGVGVRIKVLFSNYWIKLFLWGISGILAIFVLDLILIKIGLNSTNLFVHLIPPLIVGLAFWIIVWCGLRYGKGPMKFLSE